METPGISQESAANFRMIDVGAKADTQRRALASGMFYAKEETIQRIINRTLPKGDVLVLAEVAGIQGAKKTADILPLCHPLSLTSVRVWTETSPQWIKVFCEAKTVGKTGVEMEALCGVNAALLCIYDLTKGIDPVLQIGDIHLEIKEGGKSGHWVFPQSSSTTDKRSEVIEENPKKILANLRGEVITLSDRCSQGIAEDISGPKAMQWLQTNGALMSERPLVIADDAEELKNVLKKMINAQVPPHFIVTTGGTGAAPRDITPETLSQLSQEMGGKEIPGIGELLRSEGAKKSRHSYLSRSTAFLIGPVLVVCLPGSPKAVIEGLDTVAGFFGHILHVASGGGHEKSQRH